MNTTTIVIKCNFCGAVIPAAGAAGAARMATPGQPTDACAGCAQKDFAFLASSYTAPASPAAAARPQRIKLPTGQVTMLPPGAALPAGATIIG